MHRFTQLLFPNVVSFEFRISNGQMVKLSFPSNIKICDFIKDISEKAIHAFGFPKNQKLEIVEISNKNAYGITLNIEDQTMLCERYVNNYKNVSFFIACKISI